MDCGKPFVSAPTEEDFFLFLLVTQVQCCRDYADIGAYIKREPFVTSDMLLITDGRKNRFE